MNVALMLMLWLAAILLLLAALGVASRVNLLAAGLFVWVMVAVIQYTNAVF